MVSGFDIWGHDEGLRRHWKRRMLAFMYDVVISMVPTALVLYYQNVTDILVYGIYISFVFYLASAVPEAMTGASTGKWMLGFRVHATNEKNLAPRVFVRDLNRLFWFVLPPLDFTLGMATRGDPRQRMLDRVAGTKVVHVEEREKHQQYMEALAGRQPGNVGQHADGEGGEAPNSAESPYKSGSGNTATEDRCRDCGGTLMLLADDKLQCRDCGLIQ